MRVAILCEYSGIVRDAFIARGHDAISCDLLPTESPGPHIQGDLRDYNWTGFDLIIAHPECTYLCCSGNRWMIDNPERELKRLQALEFVMYIWNIPVKKMCIENPVGVINSRLPQMPKPQYIQPWQFGHGETKKTGLWLRGLPKLVPTEIVPGRYNRIHKMVPGKNRSKERARFLPGIAKAMAIQWEK